VDAVDAGYRSIDTASVYGNEAGVGMGLKQASVSREELFVTTKIWNADQGYDKALKAFDLSMKKLDIDYLDLLLVHWPLPMINKYVDTYKALEKLYKDGVVKAIGVSNFNIDHLETLKKECEITPAVNQIELHPQLAQIELCDYMNKAGIITEAWSPLGQGTLLDDEKLGAIAKRLGKSIAQVILRWDYQRGIVTIPKTVNKDRMIANLDILNFELSNEDMEAVFACNKDQRVGPDPAVFDLEAVND
jgi:methylglyoxal/glyoxal reductase